MCDYSLMNFPNRLAAEGEILVTHRFSTGSIGFISPVDLSRSAQRKPLPAQSGFWGKVAAWVKPPYADRALSAVCVAPGARLQALVTPEHMRQSAGMLPGDEVAFTQITAEWGQFRDALCTEPDHCVLLQSLGEGVAFRVISLGASSEAGPEEEYLYNLMPRRRV